LSARENTLRHKEEQRKLNNRSPPSELVDLSDFERHKNNETFQSYIIFSQVEDPM
jgi:hypothetical protein